MSTPSNELRATSSGLLKLRDRVLSRGGLILAEEVDALRAAGPSGLVAAVLDATDADHRALAATARLQLLQLWNRQSAWVESRELEQLHAFERAATAEASSGLFDVDVAGVAAEVGLITGSGSAFAEGRLEAARLLNPAGLLAETHACLSRGWISVGVSRLMVNAACELIDGLGAKATADQVGGVVAELQARVLPVSIKGIEPTTGIGIPRAYGSARDAINRAVNRIDPDRARRRKAHAHRDRGVWIRPLPDEGLAIITATLPIADATEMFEHISDLAQTLRDEDLTRVDAGEFAATEVRTLAQLRADILVAATCRAVDLLRSGQQLPDRPAWRVGLLMDLDTLTALREGRSVLPGIGEIDPELARTLAEDAEWQIFITSPLTGEILDQGSGTYRPSRRLRNFIRVRDPICTFPGCRRRSHRCQLDHIVPFPEGPTTRANLQPVCQHHHNLKTHGHWQARRNRAGTITWTSPHGVVATHDSEAEPPPF